MQLHVREIPKQIALSFVAKTNLLFLGEPGVGKSTQVRAGAAKLAERVENFVFKSIDVPSMSPPDVGTFMPNLETRMLDYFANGLLPNAYKTPDAVGIVFFDEVLSGDQSTTKLLRKYINGEDINGVLRKPPGVIIVGASNRMRDKSSVMQQDRAFMRRWEQIECYSDAKGNIDYAMRVDFHPIVQSFFKEFPALIDNYEEIFDPPKHVERGAGAKASDSAAYEEGKRGLWANMGGWERLSALEYAAETLHMELLPQRVIGNVGTAVGLQYNTHRTMFGKLATVDEIVADPKNVDISENLAEVYAQLVMLAMRVDIKKMKQVDVYLDRVPRDMKAMCVNRMIARQRKQPADFDVLSTKEYMKWMTDKQFSDLLMAR